MLPARRHEVSRLEAFGDAVLALALTLLVVSPDVPSSYAGLMTLIAGLVPFAASLALLTWIWYGPTIFFREYGPAHWIHGWRSGSRRRALEARTASEAQVLGA